MIPLKNIPLKKCMPKLFLFFVVFPIGMSTYGQQHAKTTPTSWKAEGKKPNIVFVLADDLGWTDVNSFDPMGRTYYETPNIDRLAHQGMSFTQAYANAANCAPTRAALMSGQYYPNQPIYHVGNSRQGKLIPAPNTTELPLEKITMAEALKQAGYRTGFIGKWHLGNPPRTGPQQQGFDVNIGGFLAAFPRWEGGYFQPNNNPYIDDAFEGEHLTDYLSRKAVEFIKDHRDREDPFYLQLSYYTPHYPYQAPATLVEKYQQKQPDRGHNHPTYAAMIELMDQGVGMLMQTLKELGMEENTIFVFYSDNGGTGGYEYLSEVEEYDEDDNVTDNSPLKGGKTTYYEGGIRVPLIVRWPAVIAPGTQSEEPVVTIDFYPTLLEAAAGDPPDDYQLDGLSLLPIWKDSDASLQRENIYWHFPGYPHFIYRTGPVSAIRSGPWKLLKLYETSHVELYNLDEDIGEQYDLAQQRPEVRDRLRDQLEGWLEKNNAPLPQKR
jgi:arylsulfatase A-like enzyme